jgi:hypothetical protein
LIALPAILRLIPVVLTALLVNACDTIPVLEERPQDTGDPTEETSSVRAIPLEDSSLESQRYSGRQENLNDAIEADLEEALDSLPPYRQAAYLDAAEKLTDAQRLQEAEAVLDKVDVEGLAPVLSIRKPLLQSEIYFQRNELDRALRFVNRSLRVRNIDPVYIARGLDLKARIELRQGRPLEAAKAWIQRYRYLTDAALVADNHDRTWHALGQLNQLELQLATQPGTDDELRGWLDLAILFLEFDADRHGLRTAVTQWSNANRFHPAAEYSASLLGPARAPGIGHVALLLPLSSNFGSAAQTVYTGFDAAHYTDSDPNRPQVVFYDVGGEPALAGNYVGVAASDGADVIVGPLGKASVNALLQSRPPERPIVLLGSASEELALPSGSGYQFDLAPEPEARQVAEFMFDSGHRRIGVLYPDDEWGQRIQGAFVGHWQRLGGSLAETRSYPPASDDYTASIKNLFNLTESENRKSFLELKSGVNLDFEARRRRDIDALFVAARPEEARLLNPQINFFRGHDLPVYSTSHVYTGTPDAIEDTDLDGVIFPAMPWLLNNTARVNSLKAKLSDAGYSKVSTDLFAFGFDAYQLALLVADPGLAGGTRLKGMTSELIIEQDGGVHRRMVWGQFKDGVPVRIWKR